jgi:hypothetical protein
MNLRQEQTLIYLLRELINAQDNVTHMNGKGTEFTQNTQYFIQEREKIYQSILDFVKQITEDIQ